ncbi:related to FMN-dependent 2-nitropropane dioxygenase [Cephalotrichum gorgonifer]|uniref:Related to FMN-dependent 2-nitropropane dioxygenase n=1 Tax=Cephalotrichum gorgonifer TaxID=2041049 RepID=A0AAE8N581_9PEZI|nr:related to FMN-dependent 2-nitropropane dioxygenase [Cephalotrichum gorgonifer]
MEALGIPCWHSFHLISTHFGDNEMWQEAIDRKFFGAGKPFARDEFDQLLHGFGAVSSDTPAIAFSEDLIAAYPEAKVVLVERDIDSWYKSYMHSIIGNMFSPVALLVYHLDRFYVHPIGKVQLSTVAGWLGIQSKKDAERLARDRYREHYALVRRVTPKERLLEFKLADGWEPLCAFLGKPVPDMSFPHLNDQAWFDEKASLLLKIGAMKLLRKIAMVVVPTIVVERTKVKLPSKNGCPWFLGESEMPRDWDWKKAYAPAKSRLDTMAKVCDRKWITEETVATIFFECILQACLREMVVTEDDCDAELKRKLQRKWIAAKRMTAQKIIGQAAMRSLRESFPWMTTPLVVGAPMRVFSGPKLAVSVSSAGGLGFIGPNPKPANTLADLAEARALARESKQLASFIESTTMLPVGIGFQCWDGDFKFAVEAVREHRPCAVWLFAPRHGQADLDEWSAGIRGALPGVSIWTQVGTLKESLEAVGGARRTDVLVIQGTEAGGHGRAHDGMGLMTLLPEVSDAVRASGVPVFAAGGIGDGRGVAAALVLGASGAVMGTRFLASTEARISKGYQDEVVRASDGGACTVRTMLYNQMRGTTGWPEEFSPRGIVNKSWHEHKAGVPMEELKKRYREAEGAGDEGWGPEGRLATYAGAGVGLIHSVEDAAEIVRRVQGEAKDILLGGLTGTQD